MNKYQDEEFFEIIKPIINNKEFKKIKGIIHHGITRYDHCMRVAYFSYKTSKFLNLDYKEVTEAALLHDFFIDEVNTKNKFEQLTKHPEYALENAKKYFKLTAKQEDIIKTHMFPVTLTPPKYIESWLVDIIDDAAAIYEKTSTTKNEITTATTFLFLLIINFIKMHL